MKNIKISILLAAASVTLCLLVLGGDLGVNSEEVHDEDTVKGAIKGHLQEIKHHLDKREADEDTKASTTTTTTKKPKSGASTTKKAGKRSNAKGGKTTTTSTAAPTTKKGGDEDGGDDEKEKEKDKESGETTANPKSLVLEAEAEAAREQEYWKGQEELALSYAIAGIDSWLRAFHQLGRTHSELKLGEFLYKVDRQLKRNLSPSKANQFMSDYIEIERPKQEGSKLHGGHRASLGTRLVSALGGRRHNSGAEFPSSSSKSVEEV